MTAQKRRVPRLFVDRDLSGDKLALDEREAHYLGHVLRLERGDELVAFNGLGTERWASVSNLQRRGAELELRATLDPLVESSLELTLVQALPKSDAMDLIVQKATELGARAIVPVYTEFSVVKLDAERAERRVEHWRKIAQSACEQCGRHVPPAIGSPSPLLEALEALTAADTRLALDLDASARLGTPARPRGTSRSPSALKVVSARTIGVASTRRASRASASGRASYAPRRPRSPCVRLRNRYGEISSAQRAYCRGPR